MDDGLAELERELHRVSQAMRLMKLLGELLPPPRPDPKTDPTNIGAREMVHATVLRKIEAAELRAGRLCPRCRAEVLQAATSIERVTR